MRCLICILRGSDNTDLSTDNPVMVAAAYANDAVTVYGGNAYCIKHLHEVVISNTGKSLSLNESKGSGSD